MVPDEPRRTPGRNDQPRIIGPETTRPVTGAFNGAGPFGAEVPFVVIGGAPAGGSATPPPAALRRYLLTRALGGSIVATVQWTGIALLALAIVCWLGGLHVLSILLGIVAIVILLVRGVLSAIERRISGSGQLGTIKPRVAKLVTATRRGLRHELHRVGLPSAPWAALVIAFRLIRARHRVETIQALSRINLSAAVPTADVDELHLLLQSHRD